ncbi:hypothetical protein CLF_102302 [Clonorchis sinensis]|uniref:Uncharacterized protein n=1 Tax=Clonorchis sinensis TaxID=79923 RepID=G7YN01_CLOSI|nr:hypothetical protein CLF_102302 [Clonorchis sinensis]
MKQHHFYVRVTQYQKKHYSTCCYANLRWVSTETFKEKRAIESQEKRSDHYQQVDASNRTRKHGDRRHAKEVKKESVAKTGNRHPRRRRINCAYRGSQRTLNPLRHTYRCIGQYPHVSPYRKKVKRPDVSMSRKDMVRVTELSDLEGLPSVCGKMIFDLKTIESIMETPRMF